jgi:hypothetical protein
MFEICVCGRPTLARLLIKIEGITMGGRGREWEGKGGEGRE